MMAPRLGRLTSSKSMSVSVPGPALKAMPSQRAGLMRMQSDAIRAAAASAEDARRRSAIRAYRRAVAGNISVSEAANFGDLIAVGIRGRKGAEDTAAAPSVTLTIDNVIRINNTPLAPGMPPKVEAHFAGENDGSLAIAPRGILLTPGGSYFWEAEVCFMTPDAAATANGLSSVAPTHVAAIGVVPAGYNGGLPGIGEGEASAVSAALAAAVQSNQDFARLGASLALSLQKATDNSSVTARYAKLAAGTPAPVEGASAKYRDVLGCGVAISESGAASASFFLHGTAIGAPADIPASVVGTGLLPIVWVASEAHNSLMPIAVRLHLGHAPDMNFAPLKKNVPAIRPTLYNTYGLPSGFSWLRDRLHSQLARTMITQAGHALGQLIPTSGGSGLVIEAPKKPSPGAVKPRFEWSITGTKEFPSAVLAGVALSSGRWYWEATITKAGLSQIGWADVSFIGASEAGLGVGDDKASYAYDGDRIYTWMDGSRSWGREWHEGDVICFVADLDARSLAFGLNGNFSTPMGHAFVNFEIKGGLAPALTIQADRFAALLNFGQGGYSSFRHAPPAGCRPVFDWIIEHGPVNSLRTLLGLPKDRAAEMVAALKAEAKERVTMAEVGLAAASTDIVPLPYKAFPLTGAAHLTYGPYDMVSLVQSTIPRGLTPSEKHNLFLSATAGKPTVALLNAVQEGADSKVAVSVVQTGEFAVGFVDMARFGGSWTDLTGLGEAIGSVALLNLPRGRPIPPLVTQDRTPSMGYLAHPVGSNYAHHETEVAVAEGATRRDLLYMPGLYLAANIDGVVTMRRLGHCIPDKHLISVSISGAENKVTLLYGPSLSSSAATELEFIIGAAGMWKPGATLSTTASLMVLPPPTAATGGAGSGAVTY